MDKLKLAEQALVNDDIPEFKAGDTVNVHYRVREGDKERIQQFEGVVISRRGSGPNQTFICRKISAGNIGVERIFPLYSPFIAKIEPKKEGDVRRSKLYYLRELRGKAARIKEKDRRVLKGAAEEAHKEKVDHAEPEPKTGDQKEHKKAAEKPEPKVADQKHKTEAQEKGAQTSTDESKAKKAQQDTTAKQSKKEKPAATPQEEETAAEPRKNKTAASEEE